MGGFRFVSPRLTNNMDHGIARTNTSGKRFEERSPIANRTISPDEVFLNQYLAEIAQCCLELHSIQSKLR